MIQSSKNTTEGMFDKDNARNNSFQKRAYRERPDQKGKQIAIIILGQTGDHFMQMMVIECGKQQGAQLLLDSAAASCRREVGIACQRVPRLGGLDHCLDGLHAGLLAASGQR